MKPRTALWLFFAICCAFAYADTLPMATPAAPAASVLPGWTWGAILLACLVGGGYFMLRKKNPAAAATIQGDVTMEQLKLTTFLREEAKKAEQAIADKFHSHLATLNANTAAAIAKIPTITARPSATAASVPITGVTNNAAKSATPHTQETTMSMSGITTVIPQETVDWMRAFVNSNPPAEPATSAAPGAPAAPASIWPHVITIDGINIMADADINPAWKASQMSKIIAGAYSGQSGGALTDHYIADPSNGKKAGLSVRSPAGFPLFYAIAGNGAVVGTPSILYGELSFNSDAEVMEYIARTTGAA